MKKDSSFHTQKTLPDLLDPSLNQDDGDSLPPLPSKIGPYKIESLIDKGGMSLLYLGLHPETNAPITVKVLSPKLLSNKHIIERFLKEAEIIGLTNHKNIVKLYGQGEWEHGLYIAMEFIQGISLRQYILQNPISLGRAIDIVLDIAYALSHLHSFGIIHRDLKPENILITEDQEVKVIDFGIAQLAGNENNKQALIPKSHFMGTPIYMSPEQKQDPNNASYSSDIYSLGIITYELVIGQLSRGAVHIQLVPKSLQPILKQCLQLNPKKRYQDVIELITELKKYQNSQTFHEEQRGRDYASDVTNLLRKAQETLLPPGLPTWPQLDMGLFNQKPQDVTGVYYDFFEHGDGTLGVIIGEPGIKGIQASIYSAVLRGMVRTLRHFIHNPMALIKKLNAILFEDAIDQVFTLSYLSLNPKTNKLTFISCGHGNLWFLEHEKDVEPQRIQADNIALGIDPDADFAQVEHPWNVGNTLIFSSFSAFDSSSKETLVHSEQRFKNLITEHAHLSPKRAITAMSRQIAAKHTQIQRARGMTLINILRHL